MAFHLSLAQLAMRLRQSHVGGWLGPREAVSSSAEEMSVEQETSAALYRVQARGLNLYYTEYSIINIFFSMRMDPQLPVKSLYYYFKNIKKQI